MRGVGRYPEATRPAGLIRPVSRPMAAARERAPMTDPASPVNELAERFWEGYLELNPSTATFYGDERYADRLEDPSQEGRARIRET